MQGEDLLIFIVFGISALLVPVWLFLNGKKAARERMELERKAGLEDAENPDENLPADSPKDGGDVSRKDD